MASNVLTRLFGKRDLSDAEANRIMELGARSGMTPEAARYVSIEKPLREFRQLVRAHRVVYEGRLPRERRWRIIPETRVEMEAEVGC